MNFTKILPIKKLSSIKCFSTTKNLQKKMTIREVMNVALEDEMKKDPNIFIMGEEVGQYQGAYKITKGLLEKFGDKRVIDTPITEAGFAGLCVGAALLGLKPICEFMTWNFALQAMDHIVNQAAKYLYMSAGMFNVPIVFRGPNGSPFNVGAQHSHCLAAQLGHYPGLKVIAPYSAEDHKGLLIASIRDPDPICFLESEILYQRSVEVNPDILKPDFLLPLGKANVERQGKHLTIVSYSRIVEHALIAAEKLSKEGIDCEVINMRSIRPLDMDTIAKSLKKTHRILIAEQCWAFCGIAAEIAGRICESELFFELDAPIYRLSQGDWPVPYAFNLELICYPDDVTIAAAAKRLVKGK